MRAVPVKSPIPGMLAERRARSERPAIALDLSGQFVDARFELEQVAPKIHDELAHGRRQIVFLVGNYGDQMLFESAGAISYGNSKLEAKGAHLTDECGAIGYHEVARTMNRLQVDLLDLLHLDEAAYLVA